MRVLVADDDLPLQRCLVRALTGWGYEVSTAGSGTEAWHQLKQDGAPPIAVLDWDMPGMTGIEVCRLVRATAHGAHTYVLVLTAKQQKEDLIEALEAGADDFLCKPFSPRELQLRLAKGVRDRRVLLHSDVPSSAGLVVAGATLNDKFRLERKLAEGGMGSVWLGVHLALGVNVAIKVMRSNLAETGDHASFDREARALAQLRNPHVVRVFDHGVAAGGVPYLVMEYLRGESLADRIARQGQLPVHQVVAIASQIADALEEVHAHGLVHRDVKPANILLVEDAEDGAPFAKLVDFGLATHPKPGATRSLGVAGTPPYMSPECLCGGPADAMLDLWGLACTAFEGVTGTVAFDGRSADDIYMRTVDSLPVPSHFARGVPASFDAWFSRACSRRRPDRFASVRELATALRAATSRAA